MVGESGVWEVCGGGAGLQPELHLNFRVGAEEPWAGNPRGEADRVAGGLGAAPQCPTGSSLRGWCITGKGVEITLRLLG